MHSVRQDFVYGFRGLRKQPGFASLAVLTLALGIGAATTIFSVIQNVLLDPFPYTDAERVVAVQIRDVNSTRQGGRTYYQLPEFLDLQEQSHVFEEVIGGTVEDVLLTTGEGAELLAGGLVTSNLFRFLGVPAQLGRTLGPDDAKPGAPPVFVMSYKMWVKQHSLDPTILGRTYVLNGIPTTLVGIMPRRFTKQGADIWRPVTLHRGDRELSQTYFNFQARLKPGVTTEQAESDAALVTKRLA